MMHTYEQTPDALHGADIDYLVFSAKEHLLALPYFSIVQILDSPSFTTLPNSPPTVKGVIEFMDEAIPLLDTRVILSERSLQEEVADFVKVFITRKQDHLDWIEKLKDAVDHDRDITVETDPHKCAFGRWYDTFKPNSLALSVYMHRFNKPHRAIHDLAVQAEELIRRGQKMEAKNRIHAAEKNELVSLVALFDGFEEQMLLSYREFAIVISHKGKKYALSADSIKYFETMDSIVRDLPLMGAISEELIAGIGRKERGSRTEDVIILNLDGVVESEQVALEAV